MTNVRPVSWAAGLWLASALLISPDVRGAAPVTAPPPHASVEAVYAAFTVNLIQFISWPDTALGPAGSPFVIGTFPRDPINRELDAAVDGEVLHGHPVRTIRIRDLQDIAHCQVVFISRGVANPRAILERAEHRPILTVSDADGFLALGGHVRFVPEPPHTRLQVSANNLRASGLEARSQLLRIAATP